MCRDIKLENLFISSRGHLQLGDFGLAISVLEERAISPVGTLEYMAPEILRLPSTGTVHCSSVDALRVGGCRAGRVGGWCAVD